MKSEKGIALTSVIVYSIMMVITIGIIATITTYFYNNVKEIGKNTDPAKEYTQFVNFFTQDINKKNNKVIEQYNPQNEEYSYIIFSDGTQYTFINGSVYKDKTKICENIDSMEFEYQIESSGKESVNVNYKLPNKESSQQKFTLVN